MRTCTFAASLFAPFFAVVLPTRAANVREAFRLSEIIARTRLLLILLLFVARWLCQREPRCRLFASRVVFSNAFQLRFACECAKCQVIVCGTRMQSTSSLSIIFSLPPPFGGRVALLIGFRPIGAEQAAIDCFCLHSLFSPPFVGQAFWP